MLTAPFPSFAVFASADDRGRESRGTGQLKSRAAAAVRRRTASAAWRLIAASVFASALCARCLQPPEPSSVLGLFNLPHNVNEERLQEMLGKFGKIRPSPSSRTGWSH